MDKWICTICFELNYQHFRILMGSYGQKILVHARYPNFGKGMPGRYYPLNGVVRHVSFVMENGLDVIREGTG